MKRELQALHHQHFVLDGAYELSASLAHSKQSVVYRARCLPTAPIQNFLQTHVALKLVLRERSDDAIQIVLHEAKVLSLIDSDSVVRVLDYVARKDICYLVYELSASGDLRQLLTRASAPLPLAQAISFADQLLSGLRDVHQAGVVHCDIKPANLLLEGEQVRVSDFGLAKMVDEQGSVPQDFLGLGTFEYLAPEQLQHGRTGFASDIYAAAVTIFEIFTGHRPIESGCFVEGIAACLNADYATLAQYRDDCNAALEAVIARGLAVEPEQRFASAEEFRLALQEAVAPLLATDSGIALPGEPQRDAPSYHKPMLVTACIACLVLLLLLLEMLPSAVVAEAGGVARATDEPAQIALPEAVSAPLLEPEARTAAPSRLALVRAAPADSSRHLRSTAYVGVLAADLLGHEDSYIQIATRPAGESVRIFLSIADETVAVEHGGEEQVEHVFMLGGQQLLLHFEAETDGAALYAVLTHAKGADRVLLLPYRRI